MIIDMHVHYGYQFFPVKYMDGGGLVRIMDRYNIDVGIVSNFRGIFYDFNDCNEELYSAISMYPERLLGYVVVNPNYLKESLQKLEKFIKYPQFVGAKFHASWHNQPIDGARFEPLFKKCEELGLPVLVHSYVVEDYSDQVSCPERIANAAVRYSNPVIIAHMGGNYKRTIKAAKGVPNLYVDISSGRERASQLYVWGMGRIDRAVRELGADRILFGTDMPLIDPALCLGMMEDTELSAEEKDLILYGNSCRIFNIKGDR